VAYFNTPDARMPQVVVSDYNMPGLNGIEMVKTLKNKGISFPFILLSGHLNKDNVILAVEAGAYRLLEKPIKIDLLLAVVDQLLIEHDIVNVRRDIRSLMTQLRELYTGIRLIMDQYIPEDVQNKMVVDAPGGVIKKKMSFDDLLSDLESRLDMLLTSEKLLTEMKSNSNRPEKP
jgi:FixJ family two-component response regulator